MKKSLFLIPAILLSFQAAKAQTNKGSQTLGLGLQFNHQSSISHVGPTTDFGSHDISYKLTSYSFGPTYSYFIADKLDLGLSAWYSYNKYDNRNITGNAQTSRQYGANLFLRKYFMLTDKFGLRTGPYLGYSRYKNTATATDVENFHSTSDTYTVGANADLVYYPVKKLGFSATLANLNYQHSKDKDGPNQKGNTDNFNFNLINNNLIISVFYVFGGK